MEEIAKDEKQTTQEVKRKKGGLKTLPFIMANEIFEKVASVGSHANMILYLQNEYNLSSATGATVLFLWSAISYATPILGAFFADSYMGRFRVIALGTVICLLGMIVLWLSAIIPGARPPPCILNKEHTQRCVSPNTGQLVFLFSSFVIQAIGAGGIRPCSLAFGADQLDNPNNPKNERILQSFFNWYYALALISIMISVIFLVAIQNSAGWAVGFGIPVGLMFLSIVMFLLGSSLYIKVKAYKSLFTGLAQVVAAAWKNRNLDLPPRDSDQWHYQKGSKFVIPTENLRFLNKACIIRDLEKDLDSNGLPVDPWNLCTVRQVEMLKVVIKVLPIWSTGIMVATTLSQHSFPVLQASTMDRQFIGKWKIPAASYSVFTILTLMIWVAIYDIVLVPLIAKITKRPRGLTNKQRMGTGLVLSCIATAVAGVVENRRRALASREGLADDPHAVVNMSGTWLLPQNCLTGLAEAFNAIGQIEFYYSQFPKSMSSIGVSLFSLGFALGNVMGALIVAILDTVTKREGKVSWVSNNLNRGHYDYYYWLLSILSVANFFYYLLCSKAYGNDDRKVWDEDQAVEKEEIHQLVGSPINDAAA